MISIAEILPKYRKLFAVNLPVEFDMTPTAVEIERGYNCWDCKDSGEVEKWTMDIDVHYYIWDGYKPCHCQI